ncbi:hypothetical protein HYW21_02015 [Candidatus Woesearchaeota archaeon]|nr:hypothetical protein [Candidatus Woesearchaeota archaeon]
MIVDDLKEIGLSANEAKIYIALLGLGPSTTGPLIKKTGLYRVMVYDTLEKLIRLGLVKYSLQKNRKHFEAEDPQQLFAFLQQKEIVAKSAVSYLMSIRRKVPLEQGAFVYEGWKGIRAAQENYFKAMKSGAGGEYLMVGASRELHKKLDAFFNDFHERRSKMKIPARLLFNENNKHFGKLKRKYRPVHIRFMPQRIVTPSWVSTYKDMTLIGVAEDTPMAFFIKNTAVAESYRQYFYFMWAQSKP